MSSSPLLGRKESTVSGSGYSKFTRKPAVSLEPLELEPDEGVFTVVKPARNWVEVQLNMCWEPELDDLKFFLQKKAGSMF